MKTISVRIKAGQAKQLQELAESIPGFSMNAAVQRAVDSWLEIEGPVYREAFESARNKLSKERQPVVMEIRA